MQEQKLTGYPSIDKPWLKYYSEEAINAPLPECTIYEYLWENNKDHLDDIAIIYFNRKITYGELFRNIDKTAAAFAALGVKQGDVIAVLSVTIPEVIYSVYALNKIGAVSNMIDPRTNTERIKIYLDNSNTKHIVAIDKCLSKITELQKMGFTGSVITISPKDSLPTIIKIAYSFKNRNVKNAIGISWQKFIQSGKDVAVKRSIYQKGNAATIVYTGGTTGIPKGAMLSDDTLNLIALQYRLLVANYYRSQNFLDIMPPFIAYGITCGIHMPLVLGLNNVLVPLFDPKKFDDLIIKYKPSHFLGVPTHYETLAKSSKMVGYDLSFLESAGAGGDAFNVKMEMEINGFLRSHNSKYDIAKGYGMTEVGSAAVTCQGKINKLGSVGIPHCKTTVSVFEPGTDKELSYNQEGEICISTPAMMVGYIANESETKNVLKKHADGSVWIHSNDIGYMDEDGFIYIKGRLKRMIIRPDGHNVFPVAIENVILEHEAVEGCAVVGKTDKTHSSGEWPVAFVVLKSGFKENKSVLTEIKELCDRKIPPRDTATEFYAIEKLPLTEIGKIDYRALEKQAEEMSKE